MEIFQNQSTGLRELKASFNIVSKSNPLIIEPNQSLVNELLQESQQQKVQFVPQEFHTFIGSGNMGQFTFNAVTNQEISVVIEGSQGFFNNNKLQTQVVASIFPDFQKSGNNDLHFRMLNQQSIQTGFYLSQFAQIKISFVVRDITNLQEDNVYNYRLINFDNVYTFIFSLF